MSDSERKQILIRAVTKISMGMLFLQPVNLHTETVF